MPPAKEINRLLIGILLAFGAVAVTAAYWGIVGPDTILHRDDNPRLVVAEAAIAARNDRLEVTHAAGSDVRIDLVIPGRLEKDGDDHVLTGVLLPDETEVRIKMRKIGFLKRVRISLF